MDEHRLYIPYGLNTEKEYFPGFGSRQLAQSAIGIGVISGIGLLLFLITGLLPILIFSIIVGIGGSIMFTIKMEYNPSVIDQILNMLNYKKGRQKYYYEYKHFPD